MVFTKTSVSVCVPSIYVVVSYSDWFVASSKFLSVFKEAYRNISNILLLSAFNNYIAMTSFFP